jgi:hypothetical protein
VTPVNDAPSFTKGPDQTVLEDSGPHTVPGWATNLSAGPPDESGQLLDFLVSTNNDALFVVLPAIAPDGTLTYSLAANANGSATVTVRIHDNGGTANGGADTSGPQTFVINVTPVNDPPGFTKGPDQTVLEDAGPQAVPNWATNISAGPPDESGQSVTFIVTGNTNPSLFSVPPAISPSGTLTYTTALDANGSATITVVLRDDGGTANGGIDTSGPQSFTITVTAVNDPPSFTKGPDQTVLEDACPQPVPNWATNISAGPPDESGQSVTFIVTGNTNPSLFSVPPAVAPDGTLTYTTAPNANGSATITLVARDDGGTANGGIDTSAPQTFVINVTPVNDPPSFTKGPDQTVLEDAGPQAVPNWATNILPYPSSPPPLATDEAGQIVSFLVTGNTNPGLFSAGPAVAPDGTLTYTLAANANGSATITLVARDDGGTANGGVDTSPPQTFVINVTPVNDPPGFTKGPDQTVLEDAGPQSVPNWATNISAGPPDESGQTVNFVVTDVSNPGLFAVAPAIAPDGTLTYTTAPNANGSATITVVLRDDGGTADGGIDTSGPQTFVINVTPVNDPPGFTKGSDVIVGENSGPQSVPAWATDISAGPPDESGQAVTFLVTGNSNPGLFATAPAIGPDGTLAYTTGLNAVGTATITVVARDDGGTANGGVDTSAPQTFTITVRPGVIVQVTSSPNPSVFGQPVTFTATVSPMSIPGVPTGTVTFSDGAVVLGTGTLNAGVATFTTTPFQLTVGAHAIVATYSGDGTYHTNIGSAAHTVDAAGTATTVTAAPATAVRVRAITFTARVASVAPGSGTPTGLVEFWDLRTNTQLGSAALDVNGVAVFQRHTGGPLGTHTIEARYVGDGNYAESSDRTAVNIVANGTRASTVILRSSANPSIVGAAVTFTATVRDEGDGATLNPRGTVMFKDVTTGQILGYGMLVVVAPGVSRATLTTSSLSLDAFGNAMTHDIRARFSGNTAFATSASRLVEQLVKPVPTRTSATTLIQSLSNTSYGQTVTFTARVSDTGSSGTITPTGTVVFTYGPSNTVLGTAALAEVSNGLARAVLATTTLPVGVHEVRATYVGDTDFAPAAPSDPVTHTVTTAASVLTLTSTANPSRFGQSVTFRAAVAPSTGGGVATGTVQFFDGTTLIGTGTIDTAGVATFTPGALSVGSHSISAVYQGDANLTGNTDGLSQVVNKSATRAALQRSTSEARVPVTFTTTILAVPPGAGVPTGTATWVVNGVVRGTVTLGAGVATLFLPNGLAPGTHDIVVKYSGDANFSASNTSFRVEFFNRGT